MARQPGADANYRAAEAFRQRCLVGQSSLLWPDAPAWIAEHLDSLWEAFIGNPYEGKSSFIEKWRDQLADQPAPVHRIAVDVWAFYCLFPTNMGAGPKLHWVHEIAGWKLGDEAEPPELPLLTDAFQRGIGNAGVYYLTGRPWQIAYYLRFARRIRGESVDPTDPVASQRLADDVAREIRGSSAARHILLHLLFPDRFERIASAGHKRQIVTAFHADAAGAADLDDALRNIRAALSARLERPDFDFYDDEIRAKWDPAGDVTPIKPDEVAGLDGPPLQIGPPASLDDLVRRTHLDRAELAEIAELLEEKRQLVFEGPPGSGKTYVAELFARWFVGAPLGGPPHERVELVQFHQSYDYEDFVQGIRPETDAEGHLRYRVRDGIFKRLCDVAARYPDRRFVLVIDEINRGNIARIFGELLLLLEYRDKRVRLPYAAAEEGDEAYLSVPDNLFLIGTMNSTDRSLAQVDYALRRRFYFRRFMPVVRGTAPVLAGWLRTKGVAAEDRTRLTRLFVSLNERVEELLSPDFQIGHSYFMVPAIETAEGLDRVWRRALRPLLEEYFHHHRDRERLLAELAPEHLLSHRPDVGDADAETTES